jgi:hypothetical protein
MPPSGIWLCVDLVRTDVFEERIASIVSVERICELGMLAVTGNQRNSFSLLTLFYIAESFHPDDGGNTFL